MVSVWLQKRELYKAEWSVRQEGVINVMVMVHTGGNRGNSNSWGTFCATGSEAIVPNQEDVSGV